MGDEPASVQHGTVSVVTRLDARRGVFETPYHGPVYVLDLVTQQSRRRGRALVTRRGELAAMLGKELRNTLNNTWLNYAVPIDQLRRLGGDDLRRASSSPRPEGGRRRSPTIPWTWPGWGSCWCPTCWSGRRPTWTRCVPARPPPQAGIRPDDLVLLVGDRLIQSCKALRAELELIDRDDRVQLTVLRGAGMIEVVLEPPTRKTVPP